MGVFSKSLGMHRYGVILHCTALHAYKGVNGVYVGFELESVDTFADTTCWSTACTTEKYFKFISVVNRPRIIASAHLLVIVQVSWAKIGAVFCCKELFGNPSSQGGVALGILQPRAAAITQSKPIIAREYDITASKLFLGGRGSYYLPFIRKPTMSTQAFPPSIVHQYLLNTSQWLLL
jgi:hypothetical protein